MTLCARSLLGNFFKRSEHGGYIPFNHYLWPSQAVLLTALVGLISFGVWATLEVVK